MKRSWIKRGTSQMKRSGFQWKPRQPLRRTRLKIKGSSDTSTVKDEIQDTARDIVIIRDGGCIFRNKKGHICSGFAKDGHLILQADHLITRGNSGTFADTRLIVCVCKGIHGWKSVGSNRNKAQYDEMLKEILPKDRVELWEKCERDSWRPQRVSAYDWKLELVALKQELKELQNKKLST